jgi:hypothetical protein
MTRRATAQSASRRDQQRHVGIVASCDELGKGTICVTGILKPLPFSGFPAARVGAWVAFSVKRGENIATISNLRA